MGIHLGRLKDLDLAGIFGQTDFDVVLLGSIFLLGRRTHCVQDGVEKQIFVNAFVSTHLLDETFELS